MGGEGDKGTRGWGDIIIPNNCLFRTQKALGSVTVFPPQALFAYHLLLTHNHRLALLFPMHKYVG